MESNVKTEDMTNFLIPCIHSKKINIIITENYHHP